MKYRRSFLDGLRLLLAQWAFGFVVCVVGGCPVSDPEARIIMRGMARLAEELSIHYHNEKTTDE